MTFGDDEIHFHVPSGDDCGNLQVTSGDDEIHFHVPSGDDWGHLQLTPGVAWNHFQGILETIGDIFS